MNKLTSLVRVAIHGVPRSGTSWLGEILNSSPSTVYKYQPLFSYAFKNYLNTKSTAKDILKFFQLISESKDPFLDQIDKRERGILPTFSKTNATHVVYKEVRYHHLLRLMLVEDSDLLVVLIIRNPLSVLESWLAAPREFRTDLGWKVKEEWRYAFKKNLNKPEEFYGYERWKESARLFLDLKKNFSERVFLVRYEDLVFSPESEVTKLFDFCGLPKNLQTSDFITDSRSKTISDEYSVYRDKPCSIRSGPTLDNDIRGYIAKDLSDSDLEAYIL